MKNAPPPPPIKCHGCKYNSFGVCKKNPARRMNPINGYVTYYSCESINRDGRCRDYQEESYAMQVICGIVIFIAVIICIVVANS